MTNSSKTSWLLKLWSIWGKRQEPSTSLLPRGQQQVKVDNGAVMQKVWTDMNNRLKETQVGRNRDKHFLVDFNDTVIDSSCGMKLWMGMFEGGHGISKKDDIIRNAIVDETLTDLRTIAKVDDLSIPAISKMILEILSPLTNEDRTDVQNMEFLYRRLGWMAAYLLYIEPETRLDWDDVAIDAEVVFDYDPLWVIAHPTRLLRNKKSGALVYEEAVMMPPSLTNKNWLRSWNFNMRLHLGMAATAQVTGKNVTSAQIRGVAEGYYSSLDGRLVHPYVYGYRNADTAVWSSSMKSQKEGNWEIKPVWEYPGGIVGWVQLCGRPTAETQFPVGSSVELDKGMLNSWLMRELHRQREINGFAEQSVENKMLRMVHFPRNFSQCRPAQGGPECPFLRACWNQKVGNAPLESREYVANRIPGPIHASNGLA